MLSLKTANDWCYKHTLLLSIMLTGPFKLDLQARSVFVHTFFYYQHYIMKKSKGLLMTQQIPFNIWILRYDVPLQSFHKILIVACPVIFL